MIVIEIIGGKKKLRENRMLLLKHKHPGPTTHKYWRGEKRWQEF